MASRVTEEFKGLKEVRDLSLEPSNSHFGREGYRTYSHLRSLPLLTSPISCGLISQARKRPHYPANFLPTSLDRLGLSPACLHHDMAHLIQGKRGQNKALLPRTSCHKECFGHGIVFSPLPSFLSRLLLGIRTGIVQALKHSPGFE